MESALKFRAWDKDLELMRFFTLHEVHGDPISPNWLIMRYIGLEDKSGKPIYEGDILRVDLQGPHIYGRNLQVYFHEGMFVMSGSRDDRYLPVYLAVTACREILGNIYEHPELLQPISERTP